ncbi:hypothetical protein F6Y02_08280 (plasmid) [Bacillus megaterium]|nr:hypothetical protein [Priestia megaterium]
MYTPEGKGAYLAMKAALKMQTYPLKRLMLLASHATSTKVGDISETKANKELFGKHSLSDSNNS